MTKTRDELRALLAQLRLRGMAQALDAALDRSERQASSAAELIHELLSAQAAYQRERSLTYRLDQAHLPWPWTLQTFPFERQPGVNKSQIRTLAGLDFIRRAENVILIGDTGTGKTGLGIGLLREACLNGHNARFYKAQALLDELYASLADRSTSKLLKRLSRFQPLMIDELSYLVLKPEQTNAFFRLMDTRYNRASTIITTNLSTENWYDLFQNKSLVDALLSRLKHHCITIHIKGPSLRTPEPATLPTSPPEAATKQSSRRASIK